MPGVLRTRVGYSGGKLPDPDYHDLKDHCETTQIQFDSSVVTYRQLLQIFWERHDYATPIEQQYRSAIFYHGEQQKAEAEESLRLVQQGQLGQAKFSGMEVRTRIAPATPFYVAELYHQKYYLQCNRELFKLLRYERREDLVDDPVAASLNGYLHGSGSVGAFMAEVDAWQLPFAAKFTILHHITEGHGLNDFKPIDGSQVENPLPGSFEVAAGVTPTHKVQQSGLAWLAFVAAWLWMVTVRVFMRVLPAVRDGDASITKKDKEANSTAPGCESRAAAKEAHSLQGKDAHPTLLRRRTYDEIVSDYSKEFPARKARS